MGANLRAMQRFAACVVSLLFSLVLVPDALAKPARHQPMAAVSAPQFLHGDPRAAVQSHANIVRTAHKGCRSSGLMGLWPDALNRRRACEAAAIEMAIANTSDRALSAYVGALTHGQRYSIGGFDHRLHLAKVALGLDSIPLGVVSSTSLADARALTSWPEQRSGASLCEALATRRLLGDDARMGQSCRYDELAQPTALDGFARMRYHIAIGDETSD